MSHYNVLFLCTGNSARSIMAEAILNYKGRQNFTAYSAGIHPTGVVKAEALRQLDKARLDTISARSKSWDEFAAPGAVALDFVFTVCDRAAQEICPLWPGQPLTAHWGIPDPAAVQGDADIVEQAYRHAFHLLNRRISLFLALPLATLSTMSLQTQIDEIGKVNDA